MVVVIHGTDGIVAPGLTSEDSTGTTTLNASGSATIGGALTSGSATISGALTANGLAYPTSDGGAKKVVTTDGAGTLTFGGYASLSPVVIVDDATAVAGNAYYLDSAGITLTLPLSPDSGDIVGVSDLSGGTTGIVGRNGSKIMGVDSDLTLDIAYIRATLTYTGASVGWALT